MSGLVFSFESGKFSYLSGVLVVAYLRQHWTMPSPLLVKNFYLFLTSYVALLGKLNLSTSPNQTMASKPNEFPNTLLGRLHVGHHRCS